MDPTIAPTDPAMIDPLIHPELYENRSAHVVAAAVVLLTLPTIAVILRLLSRRMSRAGLWVDDYVVVLALVLSWGPNIINLLAVRRGFGKHIAVLPLDLTTEWFKYLYAFQFLYILCMSCVKYSIIYFMYRIFPIVQFHRLLKASLYFVIALTIASVFVTIFQCVPIRDVWDTWVGQIEGRGRCIDIQLYFIISGVIHVFTDFALLALVPWLRIMELEMNSTANITQPIPLLWRLKTGKPQKWLLTAIFTVGLS
ncbi:MAG: hypothetical protein LQ348_006252 [Seirophora lacunosa]|nr:MAG: hypothetical protein LQ348_006252 [Seirophora lacunosa]